MPHKPIKTLIRLNKFFFKNFNIIYISIEELNALNSIVVKKEKK